MSSATEPQAPSEEELTSELERLWKLAFNQPPGLLDEDLVALREWFEPWASSQRLRDLVAELPATTLRVPLPEDWYLATGMSYLPTPDGRLALEELRTPERCRTGKVGPLFELYRELAQRNLRRFLSNIAGDGAPMYLVGMAAVMIILASDATSKRRSLILDHARSPEVFDALDEPLRVFVASLGQRPEDRRQPFDGFPLSRAQSRLGPALKTHRPQPKGEAMRVWIAQADIPHVLNAVAGDLSRRGFQADRAISAVRDTFGCIERCIGTLVEAGLAHDAPERRVWLEQVLVERLMTGGVPQAAGSRPQIA